MTWGCRDIEMESTMANSSDYVDFMLSSSAALEHPLPLLHAMQFGIVMMRMHRGVGPPGSLLPLSEMPTATRHARFRNLTVNAEVGIFEKTSLSCRCYNKYRRLQTYRRC